MGEWEKERLFNLEEQYYPTKKELDDKALDLSEQKCKFREKLMSDEVDKMYQVLRKFSSLHFDDVRDYLR